MIARLTILISMALLALAAACDGGSSGSDLFGGDSGGVYIALGDSVAAGEGADDPDASGYVALLHAALREQIGDDLQLRQLAVGGATTADLIDEQLPAALDAIAEDGARLITITIGGNDLNALAETQVCIDDPADPACPIADILNDVEQRIDQALSELTEAAPDAVIAIQVYPNLFSGTGNDVEEQAEVAFGFLNDRIIDVAGRHDALVADPREAFVGEGPNLTGLLDPEPDAHPNDAGHRAIADAFLDVLGLAEEERY